MPISGGSISMPSYGGDKKRVAKRKAKKAAKAAKSKSFTSKIHEESPAGKIVKTKYKNGSPTKRTQRRIKKHKLGGKSEDLFL